MKESLKLDRTAICSIKALAILGVIPAHIPVVPDDYSVLSKAFSLLLNSVGSMGVGIFFFVSGYLLAIGTSKDLSFGLFLKRKIKTLVLPWMIAATLIYLYVAIRKGGSVLGYLKSIIGYGSSFWYMSVLMFLFVFYYFFVRSKNCIWWCVAGIFLSVLSVLLRREGVITDPAFGVYLNPMNWTVFFSAGIIFSKYEKSIFSIIMRLKIVLSFAFLLVLLGSFWGFRLSYYDYFYIPIEMIVICWALTFGYSLKANKWMRFLGINSFSLYLYHELPWAGLFSRILLGFDFFLFILMIPVLVILCTLLMLNIGYILSRKAGGHQLYSKLTGYNKL